MRGYETYYHGGDSLDECLYVIPKDADEALDHPSFGEYWLDTLTKTLDKTSFEECRAALLNNKQASRIMPTEVYGIDFIFGFLHNNIWYHIVSTDDEYFSRDGLNETKHFISRDQFPGYTNVPVVIGIESTDAHRTIKTLDMIYNKEFCIALLNTKQSPLLGAPNAHIDHHE